MTRARIYCTTAVLAGTVFLAFSGPAQAAPPNPTTVGATKLSHIALNGVEGTEAVVAPGADVKINADWQDNNGPCPDCVDYVAAAFAGNAHPGCIENERFDGESGSGEVDLGPAPTTPGTYDIVSKFEEVLKCGETWSAAASTGYELIARVTVPPTNPTTVGATKLSHIALNGVEGTEAVVAPGAAVKLSANWQDNNGACPSCIDFVAAGFAGNPHPGCIENERFDGESGSGEVDLGPAPTTPGTYDIVSKFEEVLECGETWSAAASTGYELIARVTVPPAPASTSPPSISGEARQGKMLTEAHGGWENSPTSYAYRWLRCNGAGAACTPISGAASQAHLLGAEDVGHTIRVEETASNIGGKAAATSSATGVVAASPSTITTTKSSSTTTAGGVAEAAGSASVKQGVAAVKLTCTGPGRCAGTLKLLARVKERRSVKRHGKRHVVTRTRSVVIGTASFSLAKGASETLQVHLSATGNGLLRTAGKKGLRVSVAGSDVKARFLTLEAPKSKVKHGKRK